MVALPLVLAIVLHEVMHGYVAYLKGDDTAKVMGRLTLNPLAHVDLFGTIILPLILYISRIGIILAYAKPVPVNFAALRRPKEDMVWVAAAGPGTNLTLALLSALGIKLFALFFHDTYVYINYISRFNPPQMPSNASPLLFPLIGMLFYSVVLNSVLAIFNLIPIPPLDGGRIMVGLLPRRAAIAYARIEPFGIPLLIILIMLDPFGVTHRIISYFLNGIMRLLL